MKQQSERAHTWRKAAIRGGVVAIALLAVFGGGLLRTRTTHGGTPFTAPVETETLYAYASDCDPGSLQTAIGTGDTPSWSVPKVIGINDIQQCIAVRGPRQPNEYPYPASAADMQIDSELFKYATISTGAGYGTRLTANMTDTSTTDIMVMDTSGAAATGIVEIGSEYMTYSGKTATSFTGIARHTNGSSAAAHTGGVTNGDFVFATPTSGNVLDVQTQINDGDGITAGDTTVVVDSTAGAVLTTGVVQIGSEKIKYTGTTGTSFTGLTRGFESTVAAAHADNDVVAAPKVPPFDLEVGDAVTETGFTGLSGTHDVCIVNERLQFDPSASSGDATNGGADKLHITARGVLGGGISCGAAGGAATIAEAQVHIGTPGSGLRDTTRLQLLYRFGSAAHAVSAAMSSPLTTSHNLSAITLGSETFTGSGIFNVTSSTKVYNSTVTFPAPPPPPYTDVVSETNYHFKSKGTFNTATGELKSETMLNYPATDVCALNGGLYVHIPSDTTWGTDPLGNTAYGTFRIEVWLADPTCSGTPQYLLGEETEIDGQGIGTNSKSTGLAAGTDTDGDGCIDTKELTEIQGSGGRRDPFNGNDYFNTAGNAHQIRVDDILAVVHKFFIDFPAAGYTAATDRTSLHPNPWNLGPGNGLQRVDDILAVVKQFFHDC